MMVGNESDQVGRSLDFKCGMTAPLLLFRQVEAALSENDGKVLMIRPHLFDSYWDVRFPGSSGCCLEGNSGLRI